MAKTSWQQENINAFYNLKDDSANKLTAVRSHHLGASKDLSIFTLLDEVPNGRRIINSLFRSHLDDDEFITTVLKTGSERAISLEVKKITREWIDEDDSIADYLTNADSMLSETSNMFSWSRSQPTRDDTLAVPSSMTYNKSKQSTPKKQGTRKRLIKTMKQNTRVLNAKLENWKEEQRAAEASTQMEDFEIEDAIIDKLGNDTAFQVNPFATFVATEMPSHIKQSSLTKDSASTSKPHGKSKKKYKLWFWKSSKRHHKKSKTQEPEAVSGAIVPSSDEDNKETTNATRMNHFELIPESIPTYDHRNDIDEKSTPGIYHPAQTDMSSMNLAMEEKNLDHNDNNNIQIADVFEGPILKGEDDRDASKLDSKDLTSTGVDLLTDDLQEISIHDKGNINMPVLGETKNKGIMDSESKVDLDDELDEFGDFTGYDEDIFDHKNDNVVPSVIDSSVKEASPTSKYVVHANTFVPLLPKKKHFSG